MTPRPAVPAPGARPPAGSWDLFVFRPALLALVTLLLSVACSSNGKDADADPNIDTIDYEPFPTTRVLATADLESLTTADEDGTLIFAPAPEVLADLETGMVIVGGASSKTPEGLLRGVAEIVREGDRLTLRTMVVPIQLAFRRLSVRSAHRIRDVAAASARDGDELAPRSLHPSSTDATTKKNLRWILFDGDGDESTLDDQVRLEGELGGGFVFDARFEVNWGAVENLPQAVADCLKSLPGIFIGKLPDCTPLALLPEAKATFDIGPDFTAHADLMGSASLSFEKEIALLKLSLTPIPIGPIVLVPGVDVLATLQGSAGAHFRTGFDADLAARMALVASTKSGVTITPPRLERSKVEARETELAIMAKGRLSLGARISLTAYGILGPYAQINGFAEIAADTSKDPCWEVSAGLSANAGILLTTPRLPVLGYVTLFDLKTPTWDILRSGALASGRCGFAKGAALPGVGPDEQRYGRPDFPTWSNVTALPGDAPFAESAGGGSDVAFTQLERTTDGRFLAFAHRAHRLRKIDESGKTIWSRGYQDELGLPLKLGRAATLVDTSIAIATTDPIGAPAVLRIGQAGGVHAAYVLAIDGGCTPGPAVAVQALPFDPARAAAAYALTGACKESGGAYLVTASASGSVLAAKRLTVPAPSQLAPNALAWVDGSLWWLGTFVHQGIAHVAAARLDAGLTVQATSAYAGTCENNRRLEPAFARPAALRSELLVVGSSAGQHEGLVLRLRPDATVAFGSFPTFGPAASDTSVLHAIAELPTTGYLVAGSHQSRLAPEGSPYRIPAPYVAWIDAGGSVFGAKRFTLDDQRVGANAPHVALTDDGGLVLAATRPRDLETHEIWTMKMFAKDGTVTDPRVHVASFPITTASCGIAQAALPLALTGATASTRALHVSPLP